MQTMERKGMYLFLMVQAILYGIFLTLDLNDYNSKLSSLIKYIMILLCFCYALFYHKGAGKGILSALRSDPEQVIVSLMQLALLFTVVSDTFLLLVNDYYILGVISFIIVQQLYGIKLNLVRERYHHKLSKTVINNFLKRFCIQILITFLLCILLNRLNVLIDSLLVVTVFYFISIVTNVMNAGKVAHNYPEWKSNIIFAFGMSLFLLCDINVGLYNISGFLTLPENLDAAIYSISSILMWVFYAPSQVLIAISVHND